MTQMVRAAGLRGFRSLTERLGGNADALLKRQHIPVQLDDEDLLIPARAVGRLLDDAAHVLSCPDFGLRLAELQDITILGPVAVAIQNSPTIGEALGIASRYLFVHNQGMAFTALSDGEPGARFAELRYGVPTREPPLVRQAVELMVAGGHRILTRVGGEDYRLHEVHFPHAPVAARSAYRRYFGAPVLFEKETASLVVNRSLLHARLPRASETLRALAISYLDFNFSRARKSVASRVRLAVKQALGTAQSGLESIAPVLGMHPRTLQRHLADEGETFEEVRDAVLKEAALRYLRTDRLSLSDVTVRLGLSEQSALTRSCRRWFGQPPSEVRRGLIARGHHHPARSSDELVSRRRYPPR